MKTSLTKRIARQVAAVASLGALFACTSPPFNNYDPPPTFAFRYVATDPRAVGMWAGSALRWVHNFDILHPTYLPAGQTRVYQRNATFGQWYVVNDGRWPGGWNVFSDAGACAGQVIQYRVESKLAQIGCVPLDRRVSVLPGTYEDDAPPGYLTLQFNGVGGGTTAAIYIVNEGAGTLISGPTETSVDGAGQTSVPAPAVPQGHYTVVAEFADQSDPVTGGFDVVNACSTQDVWVDDYCTGTRQVCQDVTVTVEDWCPATRPVCDTRTEWVEDYCSSDEYVCDTGQQWVDDWCHDSNWVCDYQRICEGGCDEWGCWESCWDEAYNCREETHSYVCGGHWETYQHNCRWQTTTYPCGGHWETYYENCREESYWYLCGEHQETRQECRDEQYQYVCGGHWETRRTCG